MAVIRLAGDKMQSHDNKSQIQNVEVEAPYTLNLDEKMVRYIILPTSTYNIIWTFFTSIIYLISYANDSFDIAFNLKPILVPWVKTFQTVCSFIMLIDITLYFFTADIRDYKE